MSVEFVTPPLLDDAKKLAWNLRSEDLIEAVLASGALPQGTLPAAFYDSTSCYSIFTDSGELAGMCGVLPHTEQGVGRVWFLATDAVEYHSLSLIRQSPEYLDRLSRDYPGGLKASLWEGNPIHLRWATSVGFKVVGYAHRHTNLFLEIHRPSPK